MSLHESSTPKKILRTFSLQRNANMFVLDKCNRKKNNQEYKMSDELKKIKDEYEILARKNQEDLMIIQQEFGGFSEIQDFLGCSRNFQILINNDFTGFGMKRNSKRKMDSAKLSNKMLSSRIGEISFMKEKFLSMTETYKSEAEKLAEEEKKTKIERDELKKKLEENQKKFDVQNSFLKELEQNYSDIKCKLQQINTDIEKEIKSLVFDAETEKQRYLDNLKRLIELFQIERIRIEQTLNELNSNINDEKNQHFQDVEQLKQIIDDLQQEKVRLFAEKNHKHTKNHKVGDENIYQVFKEIEEHRKYSHELEIIIKNLGVDNQNLENENTDLKKHYEDKLLQIKKDFEANQLRLHEELKIFKHKFGGLQELKSANDYFLAENNALKCNLANIDEKYVRRIRVIQTENNEKQKMFSLQIEKLQMTIEKLKIEQGEHKKTIESLQDELSLKSLHITDLESCRTCLEMQQQETQNKLDKSCQLLEQTIKEHDQYVVQLKSLHETETKTLKDEILKIQKESKDFQTSKIEQETLYKILKVDFDDYQARKEDQSVKFTKEKDEIKQDFLKKIDLLNGQIMELQQTNANYLIVEQDLHKQIQQLVHNINQINIENQKEQDRLRHDIIEEVEIELEELRTNKKHLENQLEMCEKDNLKLTTEQQFSTKRILKLEEELKTARLNTQEVNLQINDIQESFEEQIEQMKQSNERILKRNKDELTSLLTEFEQQSSLCDHLDKRKKELERTCQKYSDNVEHVTKVYEREIKDLKQDLTSTKQFYEQKLSHVKTEGLFEQKKYENRINELEQELKMVKYEVEWLRDAQTK